MTRKNTFLNLFLELLLFLLIPFLFKISFLKKIGLILIFFVFIYFIYSALKKYSFKKLGLVKPKILDNAFLIPVLLISILVLILKTSFKNFCPSSPILVSNNLPIIAAFLSYSLFSAPVQELVFRAYIINRLEDFKINNIGQILISSFLFAWVHYVWGIKIVFLCFLQGLYMAFWFKKTSNLLALILAHIILGSIFGLVCFLK